MSDLSEADKKKIKEKIEDVQELLKEHDLVALRDSIIKDKRDTSRKLKAIDVVQDLLKLRDLQSHHGSTANFYLKLEEKIDEKILKAFRKHPLIDVLKFISMKAQLKAEAKKQYAEYKAQYESAVNKYKQMVDSFDNIDRYLDKVNQLPDGRGKDEVDSESVKAESISTRLKKINVYREELEGRRETIEESLRSYKALSDRLRNEMDELSENMRKIVKEVPDIGGDKLSYPSDEVYQKDALIRMQDASLYIEDLDELMTKANEVENKIQLTCLQNDQPQHVSGDILQKIQERIIQSKYYQKLSKHQPHKADKKELIEEYLGDIIHEKDIGGPTNLDELLTRLKRNPEKNGLSMRENTGIGSFMFKLFHHGSISKTDEYAQKLEKDVLRIIKEYKNETFSENKASPSSKKPG